MQELAKKDEPVSRRVVSRDEAVDYFKSIGEKYKAEIIESIPASDEIKLYSHGAFTDLCRGPHVPSTGKLKVFKLMKVAGAYWRGDSKNEQLQRIYGTAWIKKEDQDAYLHMLEEAEKRDHRKLGKQLDLFHLQDEAPGMVFWHPKGWTLWQQVEQYMRRRVNGAGYLEIKTPMVMDRSLWEASGHWQNYRENMFTTESEKRDYAIKPMNCPGHVQVFNHGLRSYRDLPLRYAEFGSCHRNEPSGALHGLMRVRGFVQDDAHIFCTEDQFICGIDRVQYARDERVQGFRLRQHRHQACAASRTARRHRRNLGSRRAGLARRADAPAVWNGKSCRARARFTARRSSTTSRTRSAVRGSAVRCSSTWCCRNDSVRNTCRKTTAASGRSCCIGRSSVRWSGSSAF